MDNIQEEAISLLRECFDLLDVKPILNESESALFGKLLDFFYESDIETTKEV